MTQRFFVYDPDSGVTFHETADAARSEAEAALLLYREFSGDGWSDGVEDVCWGEIRQVAVKGPELPAEPGSDVDYLCDYTLEAPHE